MPLALLIPYGYVSELTFLTLHLVGTSVTQLVLIHCPKIIHADVTSCTVCDGLEQELLWS